jgi:hypothetical protein
MMMMVAVREEEEEEVAGYQFQGFFGDLGFVQIWVLQHRM